MKMKKILVAILIFASSITFAQTTCERIGNGAETIVMDSGMGL